MSIDFDFRLNAAEHELLPRLRGAAYELRRKADDRLLGVAHLARHARSTRVSIVAEPGCHAAALGGLREVAPLLLRHLTRRGHARLEVIAAHGNDRARMPPLRNGLRSHAPRGARVAPPRVELPEHYALRTGLPLQKEPSLLACAGLDAFERRAWLVPDAVRAWRRLQAAGRVDGIEVQLVSAFRSVIYQTRLVQRKLARGLTLEQILQVNAAPGYSEHHSGRAIDVTCPGCPPAEEIFETTSAFAWLLVNAGRFGFRLSYPRDNPHGILYEPWHWYFCRVDA